MNFQRSRRRGFTLVELMVVIGILGLLVAVLAVKVLPYFVKAKWELEAKNMGDLQQHLESATMDNGSKGQFRKMQEKSGRAFWEAVFRKKIIDSQLLTKLVSLNSKIGDGTAESKFIDGEGDLPQSGCSYTSPKGQELLSTMSLKGSHRCVLITFDSRNWQNYEDHGVLVAWSEGGTPEYMDADAARETYKIDKKDFNEPTLLYGQKKPFDHTFEEKK